jgi:hypothetical protein
MNGCCAATSPAFQLCQDDWFGFLANTLPLPRLIGVTPPLFDLSLWELMRGLVLGRLRIKPSVFEIS